MSNVNVRTTSQTIERVVQEIKVRQLNQRLIVNPSTRSVAIIQGGPQGPAGPQGPPGANGAAVAYVYTQVTEQASWVINHNLAFYPNFHVEDEEGVDLWPAAKHHSINQLELQFNTPRAGKAHLS